MAYACINYVPHVSKTVILSNWNKTRDAVVSNYTIRESSNVAHQYNTFSTMFNKIYKKTQLNINPNPFWDKNNLA